MIIIDSLRIADLSQLVYCSCFNSENQAFPTQKRSFLQLVIASCLGKYNPVAIIKKKKLWPLLMDGVQLAQG